MRPQYAAFSDESRHSEVRFRSIAALSLPAAFVTKVSDRIGALLGDHGVQEFKWSEFKNRQRGTAARALVDLVFDELLGLDTRFDVLVWDTEDARHQVNRRDDRKNFERMFFHLHRVLMQRREAGARWHLRPDERQDIDWETIRSCLESVGAWRRHFEHPLLRESFSTQFFNIRTLREVVSANTPLCQLADFFAGIAAWSRTNADKTLRWLRESTGQRHLFQQEPPIPQSASDRARVPVLRHFYERCKRGHLGVSLASCGYLRTRDPSRPLNFWHYEPQHEHDKAPTKDVRHSPATGDRHRRARELEGGRRGDTMYRGAR